MGVSVVAAYSMYSKSNASNSRWGIWQMIHAGYGPKHLNIIVTIALGYGLAGCTGGHGSPFPPYQCQDQLPFGSLRQIPGCVMRQIENDSQALQ